MTDSKNASAKKLPGYRRLPSYFLSSGFVVKCYSLFIVTGQVRQQDLNLKGNISPCLLACYAVPCKSAAANAVNRNIAAPKLTEAAVKVSLLTTQRVTVVSQPDATPIGSKNSQVYFNLHWRKQEQGGSGVGSGTGVGVGEGFSGIGNFCFFVG